MSEEKKSKIPKRTSTSADKSPSRHASPKRDGPLETRSRLRRTKTKEEGQVPVTSEAIGEEEEEENEDAQGESHPQRKLDPFNLDVWDETNDEVLGPIWSEPVDTPEEYALLVSMALPDLLQRLR
jgi:hypothetical protein